MRLARRGGFVADQCLCSPKMLEGAVSVALEPPEFAQPGIGLGCPCTVANVEQRRARLLKSSAVVVLTRTAKRQRQLEQQVGPLFPRVFRPKLECCPVVADGGREGVEGEGAVAGALQRGPRPGRQVCRVLVRGMG